MKISNLDYMKSHSPNNPKFVIAMVKMVLEQMPPYFTEMDKALSTADWSRLPGNLHQIRP